MGGGRGSSESPGTENRDGLEHPDFWALASDVADRIGCSKDDLMVFVRDLPLIAKEDFLNTPGGLKISKKGETKIMDALGLEAASISYAEKKKGEAIVKLFVRRRVLNPRLVLACAKKEEVRALEGVRELRVMVRDASKFSPGMPIETCRHVQADLYRFEGRPPRRRGAW